MPFLDVITAITDHKLQITNITNQESHNHRS